MSVRDTIIPKGNQISYQRICFSLIIWLVIIFQWILSFLSQSLFAILTWPFLSKTQRLYWQGFLLRFCCSPLVLYNPLWTVIKHQAPPAKLPKRLIIMSNHLSDLDAFVTSSAFLPHESKYIAKSSLFKVPFGGWSMWLAGDIPIYFTAEKNGWGVKKGSTALMMKYCGELTNEHNIPIMVFPEGTRDGTTTLKPFKMGMFKFAAENDCHILPMALNGTEKAWPFPGPFFDRATIHVRNILYHPLYMISLVILWFFIEHAFLT
jgi:1-acyl-sn-glycerol-3-phosphate acyltransferase